MISLLKTKSIKEEVEKNPEGYKEIIDREQKLGICITDKNGYFIDFNERYLYIYSFKREELLGEHFTIVAQEKDKEGLTNLHNDFIKRRDELLRFWEVKDKYGNLMRISADAAYIEGLNPNCPCKITFVHIEM